MKKINTIFSLVMLLCTTTILTAQDAPPVDPITGIIALPTANLVIFNNTECDVQMVLGLKETCPPQKVFYTNEGGISVGANSNLILTPTGIRDIIEETVDDCEPFNNGFLPYSWTIKTSTGSFIVSTPPPGSVSPVFPETHCVQNNNHNPPCNCFCVTTNPLLDRTTTPVTYLGLSIVINPCP